MKPIVVVHQMGKVGSSSLFAALKNTGQFETYQTHNYLTKLKPKRVHERHAQLVMKTLIPEGRSIRFISGVRDPMARNISAFFQNLPDGVKTVDQAIEPFMARIDRELTVTRNWFDQHVKKALGVDVFQREADFSRGGHVVAGNFLILRIEDPQEAREQAVARFLGLDSFSMLRVNLGSEKPYAKLYAEFKRKFRPSIELVEETFDCRYVRHFYPNSHETMKQKWLERCS